MYNFKTKILHTTDVTPECKLIRGGGALVNLLGLFKELWCSVLIISLIFCIAAVKKIKINILQYLQIYKKII